MLFERSGHQGRAAVAKGKKKWGKGGQTRGAKRRGDRRKLAAAAAAAAADRDFAFDSSLFALVASPLRALKGTQSLLITICTSHCWTYPMV